MCKVPECVRARVWAHIDHAASVLIQGPGIRNNAEELEPGFFSRSTLGCRSSSHFPPTHIPNMFGRRDTSSCALLRRPLRQGRPIALARCGAATQPMSAMTGGAEGMADTPLAVVPFPRLPPRMCPGCVSGLAGWLSILSWRPEMARRSFLDAEHANLAAASIMQRAHAWTLRLTLVPR